MTKIIAPKTRACSEARSINTYLAGGDRPVEAPAVGRGVGDRRQPVAMAAGGVEASRGRILAAADETRRRIERDLHDGVQQRLVALGLEVQCATTMTPPELVELQRQLSRIRAGVVEVVDQIREVSRGIHPALLTDGGLELALRALGRRSVVPVELEVHALHRMPVRFEVAVYYLVSEGLTNAAKHSQASLVQVEVAIVDGVILLAIRDDGIGGADPAHGSGLVGLGDRVEALGGRMRIASPAGDGTLLQFTIPVPE
jgi:signal transduction histidine kinase